MGISGIYRKYGNFRWLDTTGIDSSDYSPVSFTANCSAVPAAQSPQCPTVTYYQPTSKNLSNFPNFVYTNQPGYSKEYKAGSKR